MPGRHKDHPGDRALPAGKVVAVVDISGGTERRRRKRTVEERRIDFPLPTPAVRDRLCPDEHRILEHWRGKTIIVRVAPGPEGGADRSVKHDDPFMRLAAARLSVIAWCDRMLDGIQNVILFRNLCQAARCITSAQDEIIHRYFGLTNKSARILRWSNLDSDDAMSVASFLFVRAMNYFDPRRGFAFSTYYMRICLLEAGKIGRRPDRLRGAMVLDERMVDGGSGGGDSIGVSGRLDLRQALDSAELSPAERVVLVARYGLGARRQRSQACIGARMGLTKQRVSQIELSAIEKLREHMAATP